MGRRGIGEAVLSRHPNVTKIRRPLGLDVLEPSGDRVYPIPLTPFPTGPPPANRPKTRKNTYQSTQICVSCARRGGLMSTLGSLWSTFELLPGPFAFNRPKIMKFVVFYRLFCIFKSKGLGFCPLSPFSWALWLKGALPHTLCF